jgi:polyisoprenoid-binding protein YceI
VTSSSYPIQVGPAEGSLSLLTGREGIAGKAGHDLTLLVTDWSGQATVAADATVQSMTVTADLPSLQVLKGEGGLKPLTDKDRATILKQTAKTLQSDKHPKATFVMAKAASSGDEQQLTGTVEVAGSTQPMTAALSVTPCGTELRVVATADVLQSAFGIKPYVGMLGALKVKDLVQVRIDVTIPSIGP